MAGRRGMRWLRSRQKAELWRRWAAGEPVREIATAIGCSEGTVRDVVRRAGGIVPLAFRGPPRPRSPLRLRPAEREEISRGLRAGEPVRRIADRLGRAPSTVSREVSRNGGRERYRAVRAGVAARARARRPKVARLARDPRLRAEVERLLLRRWSPAQIAHRLRLEHPDDRELRVSHETIYQALFVQGRGALRRELAACLRTGRARRRAQVPAGEDRGRMAGMVLISERPAEVADRAVPGHWEGDLLVGKGGRSAIATLVERRTRYVLLAALPAGRSAPAVRDALVERVVTLPALLRRSLTWDRGHEMAEHLRFTVDTGVAVYFCDPHSPWQRGTNENTNGLLRQYLPRGVDLAPFTQAALDAIAAELNARPRQTLGWMTPSEALAVVVAKTG
jgi:transposase, IS30 family